MAVCYIRGEELAPIPSESLNIPDEILMLLRLADEFLTGKLSATLTRAVVQLDSEDPERKARRLVFCVLLFNDRLGDCQSTYLGQIDEHLLTNPVDGAELVFDVA